MDQQLELKKNPVPAKEQGEKPVTAGKRGEKPVTASEHGEKPVTASEHGEKPVTAGKCREKPVTASKHGEKPATANEQGGKPMTENEIGKKPVTASEQKKKMVTANKLGEKPVTANKRGDKPVTAHKQGERPVTAIKLGERPVTAHKQGERPVTAHKQGEKPVTAIKLGEKPVTANKLGEKPVNANKRGDKPVTANEQEEKPVTEKVEKPVIVEDQARGQKELWSARLTDFLPSPSPIERMRSAGESEAVSGSPISPLRSPDALPLPLEVAAGAFTGIQASSFYRSERGSSARKTPSAPSLSRLQAVPTPVLSPLHPLQSASPPLLTSTALEPSVPNSPFLEDSLGLPACLDSFKSSSSQSIPLPKLPSSNEQFKEHMSGPGLGRKRPPSHHSSSASEEEEEEGRGSGTGQRMSMRPRKLFKTREEEEEEEEEEVYSLTCPLKEGGEVRQERGPTVAAPGQGESLTDAVRDAELCSVVSSRVVSSFWEANMEGAGDLEAPEFNASQYMSSMCRQFNSELQRKIQNRSRRMDHFAKQSLKTVQQHVSSVSVQIHQYRSQKLEKIRGVLLEEIHNLEKDNSDLKDVEKELTTYWRKQTQAFHSYQERESKRLQNLRSTFQKNVCHSLEYEEQIFTSEMCLMREDMKSVQDKLFKDMQEEEMLSVRRGLQALFLPEGCRF
ncbi:nucleolar and coiled-body phosphoprotein 1-like [Anguilla anguilla]|uniref:nucleolar and coiled-body phosphoprotein 1-like n=1 Tax=Anguilla anguilla TaxID=7936 RepID=UPI0015A95EC4|nr:nucleolar and coiled-body phosphoprotein 1-like [Anguilla anguilla]